MIFNKKNTSQLMIISLLFSTLLLNFPVPVKGQASIYENDPDFNPNRIMEDSAVRDFNSLTMEQIKSFVVAQGGTLGTYIDPMTNLPAYAVIWQTAQEFQINPKFILTMLQKEQSLVTDSFPTQNQYDWAVGYSCYGGVCFDQYKGFSQQIRSMTNKFINDYLADLNELGKYQNNFFCTFTKWCVGSPKQTQDEQLIIPQNKITAALYTYNPYRGGTIIDQGKVGANYNFWKIWRKWFADSAAFRPSGTLVKSATDKTVYLIQNGKKRPFANFSSLTTRYDPNNIITIDVLELDKYELGPAIKFPQYSLLKNETGEIFLLVDDSLRKIANMEVFKTLGFNPEEVEDVTTAEIADLARGKEITINDSYPTGALAQDATTGGIYYVENGIKYPLIAKEILKTNFPGQKIISIHPKELDEYPKGEAVKFKDGILVKAIDSSIVYVISAGKKLPIKDEASFLSRGYQWNKIVETSQAALDLHPTGETLEALVV